MSVNVMSEKIQVADTEETFVGVDDNSVGGEAFENRSQVLEVLFGCGTCD